MSSKKTVPENPLFPVLWPVDELLQKFMLKHVDLMMKDVESRVPMRIGIKEQQSTEPLVVAPTCKECNGTGQYVGLNITEDCKACCGSGNVLQLYSSEVPSLTIDESAQRCLDSPYYDSKVIKKLSLDFQSAQGDITGVPWRISAINAITKFERTLENLTCTS